MAERAEQQAERTASIVAVALAAVGIVVAFLPGWGFWLAWGLGAVAVIIGLVAHKNRSKAGLPPGLARVGWAGGIVAFALGWVTLFAID